MVGYWKGVLVIELVSGIPPFSAPAASALGTPPAMRFPDHHLDSTDFRLRRGSIRPGRERRQSALDNKDGMREVSLIDFQLLQLFRHINFNIVESQKKGIS